MADRNVFRWRKRESVVAAAEPGCPEVFSIEVGERLPDQMSVGVDVEADRRFGMVGVLGPAGDQLRVGDIDVAAERAARRCAEYKPGAGGQAQPYRLDLEARIRPRRAVTRHLHGGVLGILG